MERAANGLFWNAQRTDCFGTRSERTVLERAAKGLFWNAQRTDRFGTRSEGTVLERGAGSSGRRSACRATADTKIDKLKFLAADGESVTVPQFMPLLWL